MKYTTKVWFGCTTAKLLDYIDFYNGIRQHLLERNSILPFDWLKQAEDRIRSQQGGARNIKKVYREVLDAINEADVCVIENTVSNFSVAHQITYALSQRKPTLVLWQRKDNESFTDSYLEALESKYLTIKEYKGNEYKDIIDSFLGLSKIEFGQMRYNIILENKQRYYLDWASSKYKKSRSALIREALDKQSIDDPSYYTDVSK